MITLGSVFGSFVILYLLMKWLPLIGLVLMFSKDKHTHQIGFIVSVIGLIFLFKTL